MRIALVLVMVCGCGASMSNSGDVKVSLAHYAPKDRQIAAPTMPAAKEWRVGQWAVYKARVAGADAVETISVGAKDGCGVWIGTLMRSREGVSVWLVCFRDDPKLSARERLRTAIGTVNGDVTTYQFVDGKAAGLSDEMISGFLGAVVPLTFPSDAVQDDITVPAGHFVRAMETHVHGVTRWIHSDVPFNGTVKLQVAGVDDRVLLAYGDTSKGSVITGLERELAMALAPPRPRGYIELGFAAGGLTGHDAEPSHGVSTLTLRSGGPISDSLEFVFESSRAAIDDDARSIWTFAGGVRWSPFGAPRYSRGVAGASALYVRGVLGYAELDEPTADSPMSTTARGLGLGAAVGWAGLQAHDYAVGLELGDRISVFDNSEGTRQNLALEIFVKLFLPDLFR